jgi:hypothetical protein
MVQVPVPVTPSQMMCQSLASALPPLVVLVAPHQPTYLMQRRLGTWTLMMQLPALDLPARSSSKNGTVTATATATVSATAKMATEATPTARVAGFDSLRPQRRRWATTSAGGSEATTARATTARATTVRATMMQLPGLVPPAKGSSKNAAATTTATATASATAAMATKPTATESAVGFEVLTARRRRKTRTLMVQVPVPVTPSQMMCQSLAPALPPLVVLVAPHQPTYLMQRRLGTWTLMMQLPALDLPARGSSKNAAATTTATATASATAAMATEPTATESAVGFEALTARRRRRATTSARGSGAPMAQTTMARATMARHRCRGTTSAVANKMVAAPASEQLLPSAVATQGAAIRETRTWGHLETFRARSAADGDPDSWGAPGTWTH